MLSTRDTFKDTNRFKVKRIKNKMPHKQYQKKRCMDIFLSDKKDFKTKTVTRDKKGFNKDKKGQSGKHEKYKYICIQPHAQFRTILIFIH